MKNKLKEIIKKIKNLSIKKRIIIYLVVIVICTTAFYGLFTFSRYVIRTTYNNFLQSREFYFYSSVLADDNSAIYSMHDWDGINEYQFQLDLKNSLDELRWTKEDISYETDISCSSSIGGIVACSSAISGTILTNESGGTTNQVNITLANPNEIDFSEEDYVDIEISIISTSPYRKTLSATFRIYVAEEVIRYSITDVANQKYLQFQISNFSRERKLIRISWNHTVLSVDNTNILIQEGTVLTSTLNGTAYESGNDFYLDSKRSAIIIFYKKDPTIDYTYPITNANSVITVTELPII